MNKMEQIVEQLKKCPMSNKEMFELYGKGWNKTCFTLKAYNVIEKFEVANEESEGRYARTRIWKWRVIGEYKPKIGNRKIDQAIALLREKGYVVIEPK